MLVTCGIFDLVKTIEISSIIIIIIIIIITMINVNIVTFHYRRQANAGHL